jgi:hypothetical protein
MRRVLTPFGLYHWLYIENAGREKTAIDGEILARHIRGAVRAKERAVVAISDGSP